MGGEHKDLLHRERLKKHLSGAQLESLLNYYIYKTLEPIVQTLWFKNQVSLLICKSFKDTKIKISTNKERNEVIIYLYNLISTIDKGEILFLLKTSNLDRGYLKDIAQKFIEITDVLLQNDIIYQRSLLHNEIDTTSANTLSSLSDYFQGLSLSFLISTNKEVKYWFNKYLEFKELVAEKYYRFAYQQALSLALHKQSSIDKDCLFKSFLMAIDTALDKYTSERGTLTSYIHLWFKSTMVNPKFDYEMGYPFKMSLYAKKKSLDYGMTLHAISTDSEEYQIIEEGQAPTQIQSLSYENLDGDILQFLDSVLDKKVALARIILRLPKLKNLVNNNSPDVDSINN